MEEEIIEINDIEINEIDEIDDIQDEFNNDFIENIVEDGEIENAN